jgi:hypothetical protein
MERKYSSVIIKFNWIFNTSEIILLKASRIPSISHWIEHLQKVLCQFKQKDCKEIIWFDLWNNVAFQKHFLENGLNTYKLSLSVQ